MELVEMIEAAMTDCDNDVHIAIERVAKQSGESKEELYAAYDAQ
jgi:archaellum component FlaC